MNSKDKYLLTDRLIPNELLATFEYENFKMEMYYCGDSVGYKVFIDGELVEWGDGYKPGAGYNWDDPESVVSLLGFMMLREGDVEEEFFKDRKSNVLLEFAEKEDCIRMMIYDYELSHEDYYLEENDMTYAEATRILDYITN